MSTRGWFRLAVLGVVLVLLGMGVTALVLLDKPHFGFLVGSYFVPVIASGVIVGALLVLAGVTGLPQRKTWRGIALILWGLIAVTSPLFGYLFLLPWAAMLLLLPVAIVALVGLGRQTAA